MKTCCLKITSTSFLKYVKYKLNCSTCSHENKIMRFSQLSWKILRKLSNQNHMLIHDHLYLRNIMIWLMFLRDKMSMSCLHIEKNTTLRLNWNQKKSQTLNSCIIYHETNFKYYNNILINILQKISFDQAVFCLCFWCYSQKNWAENYISALIIEFWMQSWFKIDIWFSWFKKC